MIRGHADFEWKCDIGVQKIKSMENRALKHRS